MYTYLNVHPKGLSVGDCVKRAITKAANMDYMEVQRELNRYKKVTGAKSFNSDYNPHKYVENVLHGIKLSFPAVKGQPRMNGERFSKAYPKGSYILNMAGHWSCCVDGVIYDTWDCSDKCVYTAYKIIPQNRTTVKKNCYAVTNVINGPSRVIVYDKQGNDVVHEMNSTLVSGYIRCLEDMGYTAVK